MAVHAADGRVLDLNELEWLDRGELPAGTVAPASGRRVA
jgi:hypothetical protein